MKQTICQKQKKQSGTPFVTAPCTTVWHLNVGCRSVLYSFEMGSLICNFTKVSQCLTGRSSKARLAEGHFTGKNGTLEMVLIRGSLRVQVRKISPGRFGYSPGVPDIGKAVKASRQHEAPYLHIQVVSVVIVHHLGVDPRDQLECHFLPFPFLFFADLGFQLVIQYFQFLLVPFFNLWGSIVHSDSHSILGGGTAPSRPTPLQLLLVFGVVSSAATATTTKSTTNSKKS